MRPKEPATELSLNGRHTSKKEKDPHGLSLRLFDFPWYHSWQEHNHIYKGVQLMRLG